MKRHKIDKILGCSNPRIEDFNAHHVFTVPITLLVAATVVWSHFWFRALPLIFTSI